MREPLLINSQNELNIWYVYRHIREDKNIPFYVGIGCAKNYKRALSITSRNKRWKSITKNNKYYFDIIFENLTKENAIKKEKEFILIYGRESNGGLLCNQTDGGEGVFGRENIDSWKMKLSLYANNMTDTHKKNISKSKIGHKSAMSGKKLTQEQKDRISIAKKNKPKSEAHKEKLRLANLGKKLSQETKDKIKSWNINVGHSDENKKKMSLSASYKRSEETKKKMSESRKEYYKKLKLNYGS
jgi:hypothetical protein